MRNLLKYLFICIILFSVIQFSNAQRNEDLKSDLAEDIAYLKGNGKYNSMDAFFKYERYYQTIPEIFIEELSKFTNDSCEKVNRFVNMLLHSIGSYNDEVHIRQKVVYHLVTFFLGKDQSLKRATQLKLEKYRKEDYSDTTAEKLIKCLSQGQSTDQYMVRYIGLLDRYDQIPTLKRLLADPEITKRTKWEIQITLARLGDLEMISYCTDVCCTKDENGNSEKCNIIDLCYIKQKPAVEKLIEILYSDKRNCVYPDLKHNEICAYRVMEELARFIEGFPYKFDTEKNKLNINNYDLALETVKKWFRNNPDYKILRDKF